MTLTLGETWSPWHPSVHRGTLETPDGPKPVLALLAPWQPVATAMERPDVRHALAVRGPDVLRLLDIRTMDNRLAWIYAQVDGIAASNLFDGRALGLRAAAELVARTARCVAAHGHPGPEPEDVLVLRDGSIRLANFARPFPGITGARAPGRGTPEALQVYRIGALLAFLLGGPMPGASTPDAHDAAVRRAQIRAMSRPGAVFTEAWGNWLRALLAWDPADRPPLSRVLPGLEELVATTPGPTLAETCEVGFTGWLEGLTAFTPDTSTFPLDHWEGAPTELEDDVEFGREQTVEQVTARQTLADDQIVLADFSEDDPTVDSELGIAPEYTPPSVIERGSIPVSVGPPAEEAARRPSLPLGFLGDATQPAIPSPTPPTQPKQPVPPRPPWLWPTIAVMCGVALGLALWLLFG